NATYLDAFMRLRDNGVRLFSTGKLFNETMEHLGFANALVRKHGADSPHVVASATGQPPYYRQNVFLQGLINWQAAGGLEGWEGYLFEAFGTRSFSRGSVFRRLQDLGIQTVDLSEWPGFVEADFAERDTYSDQIKEQMRNHRGHGGPPDVGYEAWLET